MIKNQFATFNPCLYAGAVPCSDCKVLVNTAECDMKQGRELKQQTFLAGYRTAIIECAGYLMKPQPSTTTFCCLGTLSRVSEQLLDKLAE